MEEGYFVPAIVANMPLTFLVDTGSNITILSKDLLDVWPQEHFPNLTPVSIQLVTATGECSPFYGKAEIQFTIGNQNLSHEILFADIKNDGILGVDFLSANRCDVLLSKDHLVLNGEKITCYRSTKDVNPNCCRIALTENVHVPPGSEMIVPGRPLDSFDKDSVGILEASEAFASRYGLLVAKALVSPKMGTVPLRIMNVLDQPCFLRKSTVAAIYEPVDEERVETLGSLEKQPSETVMSPDQQKTTTVTSLDQETSQKTSIPDSSLESITHERVSSLETAESVPFTSPCSEKVPEKDSYSHIEQLIQESSTNLDESQKQSVRSLLCEYSDQFSRSSHDLGSCGIEQHTIKLKPGSQPIKQRPYRIPLAKREIAKQEIKLMAEKKLIEPSYSAWCSPAVLVPKRDGSTRFCIDYRRLNAVTVPDSHPLPRTDDTLSALGGAKWFSTLDLRSGYHQIEIQPSDRPLTAFAIPGSGLWQFRVLPFGLINGPSAFERALERIMVNLAYVILLIYLDDIIVYSKTFEAHLENLKEVLERLRGANLKLHPTKCKLFAKQVSFLGHRVSEEGISTDPEKVKSIRDWPQPRNVKELRSFLGLASYYRKFCESFATICKPLHKLTEKNHPFDWTPECQSAFDTIKKVLTTAPVLGYPSTDGGHFVIDCDASNVGIGSVLHQLQDGKEVVIGYFSRCLSKAERKYCTTRKELLAVVASVKHFHQILYGQQFIIRSDHSSLQWLLNFKNGEGQLARFLETLSAYTFKLEFRYGRLNSNADSMSRRPCYEHNCQYCSRYENRYGDELLAENHTQPIGESGKKCTNSEQVRSATTNHNSVEHKRCASLQDCDPVLFSGPLCADDSCSGRQARPTTCLEQRVTSVHSDEMSLWDFTARGPSPFAYACTAVVDEKTHKINNVCSRPPFCSCQRADDIDIDWLDLFEEELLLENLFETEQCEGVRDYSDKPRIFPEPSTEMVQDCLNVDHAGMISTRETTHGDKWPCPGESYLPCASEVSNLDSSGSLQSSISGNGDCEANCSCNKQPENHDYGQPGCPGNAHVNATTGQNDTSPEISMENIRLEQEKDQTLSLLLQWKKAGIKPDWATVSPYCKELKTYWYQWDSLEIQDEVLCKKYIRADGSGNDYMYIIPMTLRKECFMQLHAYITGGHLGRKKTYEKLKQRFYWCNMHRDVSYWCRICPTCGSRKLPPRRAKAPMRQYNVGYPMERIAIDISGPYHVTKKGNKYILVVSDYFTRWVDAFALKSTEATHVAEVLVNRFISIFGVPLQLHSDRGSNFQSKVFQEVCNLLGIQKTRTTARRPQSDGMVERANRTIQNMIASYVSDKQDDWDDHLPLLMLAYRSSVHETIGVSPAMMMFGRELTLPIDLAVGRPVKDDRVSATDYAYQLEEKLLDVHKFARRHLNIASDSMKRRYDLKTKFVEYQIGDPVWYFKPRRRVGFSPKFQGDWKGPMVVTERLNNVLYRVKSSPRATPDIAHHDFIRLYECEDKPTWFVPDEQNTA